MTFAMSSPSFTMSGNNQTRLLIVAKLHVQTVLQWVADVIAVVDQHPLQGKTWA